MTTASAATVKGFTIHPTYFNKDRRNVTTAVDLPGDIRLEVTTRHSNGKYFTVLRRSRIKGLFVSTSLFGDGKNVFSAPTKRYGAKRLQEIHKEFEDLVKLPENQEWALHCEASA
jgi:hypothetical protein